MTAESAPGGSGRASIGRSALSDKIRAATRALIAGRAADATVCPSEVARAIAAAAGTPDWRAEMAAVHIAVDEMVAEGLVRLSWKSVEMPVRKGPYRIGRAGPVA